MLIFSVAHAHAVLAVYHVPVVVFFLGHLENLNEVGLEPTAVWHLWRARALTRRDVVHQNLTVTDSTIPEAIHDKEVEALLIDAFDVDHQPRGF